MCGISGIIHFNAQPISLQKIKKTTDEIAHRGPDGEGHWISPNGFVALGHRRLSIIDLSNLSSQPLHFANRYTIVYNGEIYNYLELKKQLLAKGYTFKTTGDTEVLVAMYDAYKHNCLQYLDGMFAFAIYDNVEQNIFCAIDRFGEKPFFYSYEPGKYFYFGSELKCLWAAGVSKSINSNMLFNYLAFNTLENIEDLSQTFYNDCYRLPHAHFANLNLNKGSITITPYYNIDHTNINYNITLANAKEKFRELFYTSIQRRLRSDVPVGSSLSGGLDSSLIVTAIGNLNKNGTIKQDTFSAIFPGFEKDESIYIKKVLEYTNVNPHYISPNEDGIINDLEKLIWHQEEPFPSASIYIQYCIMQLAKQNNITVLLDGQGADEILAGYHNYYGSFFKEIKSTNNYATQLTAYKNLHNNNTINGLIKKTNGDRVRAFAPNLVTTIKKYYLLTNNVYQPFFNNSFLQLNKDNLHHTIPIYQPTLNQALYNNTFKCGLQQLLRYADRNSMAMSREVRLPFLNHELVDFLFSLPSTFKINNGWTKWLMRETFGAELPKEIAWRKDKIGYEPPQQSWMQKPIMQDFLQTKIEKLVREKYIHSDVLTKKHNVHHVQNMHQHSWRLLMAGSII